jgi:tetratricopeptide (TPR) repeat protein
MRLTPLSLIAAALLAVSAGASSDPLTAAPAALSETDASQPAAELLRLDGALTAAGQAQRGGRISAADYEKFLTRFEADLEAARAGCALSPVNTALYARILARLGKSKRAAESLGVALRSNPDSAPLRMALGEVRFGEKNYPAALAEANAVLERDPGNREALTLKHFSEGRAAMNDEASGERTPSLPAAPAARGSFARKFHFVAADPATLPYKLPVRISPAAAPPALPASRTPTAPGPLPLLPLAGVALGLAAYEVSRSRGTYESSVGRDDEHPKPVGRWQRLVANTILAGAAGAVIYLAGVAIVSAAPVALTYASSISAQGVRLAGSAAGAINPDEVKPANEVPEMLARVIPYESGITIPNTIGLADRSHAFVTAAEDIDGLSAVDIPQRLGIASSPQYLVIRFPAPSAGLSTPLTFDHPLFTGGGLTSGGAREFFITNGAIPSVATYQIIK